MHKHSMRTTYLKSNRNFRHLEFNCLNVRIGNDNHNLIWPEYLKRVSVTNTHEKQVVSSTTERDRTITVNS